MRGSTALPLAFSFAFRCCRCLKEAIFCPADACILLVHQVGNGSHHSPMLPGRIRLQARSLNHASREVDHRRLVQPAYCLEPAKALVEAFAHLLERDWASVSATTFPS